MSCKPHILGKLISENLQRNSLFADFYRLRFRDKDIPHLSSTKSHTVADNGFECDPVVEANLDLPFSFISFDSAYAVDGNSYSRINWGLGVPCSP